MPITRTPFPYRHGNAELEGILVRDESFPSPSPGVLLIHEFTGLTSPMLTHAERLAAEGHVVLACDMYGRGIRPADNAEASRISRIYRNDRKLTRGRAAAGLAALDEGHGFCNPEVRADARSGSAYDPLVAERAWREILSFLESALCSPLKTGRAG